MPVDALEIAIDAVADISGSCGSFPWFMVGSCGDSLQLNNDIYFSLRAEMIP